MWYSGCSPLGGEKSRRQTSNISQHQKGYSCSVCVVSGGGAAGRAECEGEVVRQTTINAAQCPVGRGKERGQLAQGSGQGEGHKPAALEAVPCWLCRVGCWLPGRYAQVELRLRLPARPHLPLGSFCSFHDGGIGCNLKSDWNTCRHSYLLFCTNTISFLLILERAERLHFPTRQYIWGVGVAQIYPLHS